MIWCILESKSAALVAAIFVDFPKNKCNFLHKKQALYRMAGPILYRAAPYEEFFFSWGSRHHCPMEVGAYDKKITRPYTALSSCDNSKESWSDFRKT